MLLHLPLPLGRASRTTFSNPLAPRLDQAYNWWQKDCGAGPRGPGARSEKDRQTRFWLGGVRFAEALGRGWAGAPIRLAGPAANCQKAGPTHTWSGLLHPQAKQRLWVSFESSVQIRRLPVSTSLTKHPAPAQCAGCGDRQKHWTPPPPRNATVAATPGSPRPVDRIGSQRDLGPGAG